uniref:Cell cycle checkpoint control protein RAD9A n=1 Tax=Labrus bergylta TaxID=56723 RepID=A0A3Q3LUX2_9LABR
MDCVVTGGNVKVLAKAIQSLSRIGDELYVEPQEDGLALRSVNSSRSAYACFLFAPLFFSRCEKCAQSVQAVFRSLASLEKTVEKCHIELDEQKNRLTFTLHCKHGLLKTHNLSFQDSESLQAVFDKDSYANEFRSHPRSVNISSFYFKREIQSSFSLDNLQIFVLSKAMLTELCLASDEFDHFAVKAHNSVTFCLKELRGLLVFAESTGLPISMYFDEPGSPVVLSVTDNVLEGNFVLATLSEDSNHCKNNTRSAHTAAAPPDDFMNDDMDSYIIAMDTSMAPGPSTTGPPTAPFHKSTCSKQLAAANHRPRLHSEEEEEEEETEDLDRPPNKKFCSLFFGSVLPPSSQMTTQPVSSQEVLASDSEDDSHAE